MTASDRNGGDHESGRPTMEPHDHRSTPLKTPAASRATLARRLRAVERALSGTDDVAFEAGGERTVDPAASTLSLMARWSVGFEIRIVT